MQTAIRKLREKQSLSPAEMTSVMESLVSGKSQSVEIEEFLLLLRDKGETVGEIVAAAKVMRAHSVKLSKTYPDLLDTCGTGGDAKHTFNVSTLSALVAAAAGARVAKHGNRSVSSTCGSADLLETLGVRIDLPVPAIERSIEAVGFGFFFAPLFHPATRFAMPARKKLGGKTLFNLLGPLSNPAGAAHQLIGVYDAKWVEPLARALLELGSKNAWVVHGADGIDEISLSDKTHVAELQNGAVKTRLLSPEDFGLRRVNFRDLVCSSKEEACEAALKILKGAEGPKTEMVIVNAAAALVIAGKADSIQEGVRRARALLKNGEVFKKFKEIASFYENFK